MGDFENALWDVKSALAIEPENKAAKAQLSTLKEKVQTSREDFYYAQVRLNWTVACLKSGVSLPLLPVYRTVCESVSRVCLNVLCFKRSFCYCVVKSTPTLICDLTRLSL